MATARKINRKELKKDDEFVQAGNSVVDWVQDNVKQIAMAVGGVFGLGLVVVFFAGWMESSAATAAADLGNALELADRPIVAEAGETTGDDPFFGSEDEKNKAMIAALETVRKDHKDTPAAMLAGERLGDLAFEMGDTEAAEKHYRTFLSEAPADHPLRYAAFEGLGYIYEDKGEHEKALTEYENLAKITFYKPFALVHEARIYHAMGRPEDARHRAQQVLDEYPEHPARAEANHVLEKLPPAPLGSDTPADAPAEDGAGE